MKRLLATALVLCMGCAAEPAIEPAEVTAWSMSDGRTLEFVLSAPAQTEVRDGAVRYRLGNGVVVTVQEIDRAYRHPEHARSAVTVAGALVDRVALSGREGQLSNESCMVGELRGQCLTGWMTRGDARFARSGAVVETSDRIVWIDVAMLGERDAEVADRAGEILNTVRIVAG